jgi:beta-glucuronidase
MRRILIILIFIFFSIDMQSEEQITNVLNRNITSLNGKWQIIVDPYDNGYYNYRMEESSWGFFTNQKPKSKSDLVEYDFDKSETLNVPGDWNSQKPELLYYEGSIWYKKSFDYHLTKGKRLFLWFGAVNYKADIYLNGKKLGTHEGGFTPFNYEITPLLKEKDNFVILRVNNQRKPEYVPTVNTDWWNYGGITRDVFLIEEDSVFIQDYSVQLDKNNPQKIIGYVKLNLPVANESVSVNIPELKISIHGQTSNNGVFSFAKSVKNLIYWQPLKPKLYEVILKHDDSFITDRIGFRTVTASGHQILVNGQPVFLKGISIHEEMPQRKSRANGYDDAKILLGWAKELGCNFVRLAHYPHNEWMIRMADSMGLLVWSEVPVYWTIQFDNPSTLKLAQSMINDNITRDKNRACIIIWSVGNETPVNEIRTQFLKTLANYVRQLDSSRLVSAAMEVHTNPSEPYVYHVDDPLGQFLDVIACNEYIGWYDGLPDKTEMIQWQTIYEKPFIFSELGAEALYGFHGDSLARWTEEYQDYFYHQQIKMLEKVKFLTGMSPWILADFRSPRRQLPFLQDFWNRKGLISDQGQRKKAFFTLQKWYNAIK